MRFSRVLLAISLGVFVAAAILEVGLRLAAVVNPAFRERIGELTNPVTGIALDLWASHPFLPFIGQPGADYTTLGDLGVYVNVRNNRQGFRTHEFPAVKQPNDRFIVCLGESTTWGSGAESNAATWPELLEAKLSVRYPDLNIKVFNLGVPAGATAYSLVALSLIGVRLHPDLVIVYHGINEHGAMMETAARLDQSSHFYDFNPFSAWKGVRRNLPAWMLGSYAFAYGAALIDDSLRVNSMGFHIVRDQHTTDEFPNAGVRTSLENLHTLASIAAGEGADTLFSTFQFYDGDSPVWKRFNATLREFFEKNGFWWVDQDSFIPDYDRSINADEVHFTRKGDELMADNFFAAIVARGTLEKASDVRVPLATGFE